MITTILNVPPNILKRFDRNLLSQQIPKFCDDSERLLWIFQWIENKLSKKAMKHEGTRVKYERLKKQFLELYERAKAKEVEFEKKTGQSVCTPFNYFREANRRNPHLLRRLRAKRIISDDSYMG